MPADVYVTCRVSQEVKTRLRALADREGATESGIVKELIATVLRDSRPGDSVAAGEAPPTARGARLTLRLAPADRRALADRAASRKMAPATYVAVLVSAHLHQAAPIPKAEYQLLRQCVSELGAIGRELNTIAGTLARDTRAHAPGRAEVQAMVKIASGLRDHVKELLLANARAWRDGDA